MVGVVANRNWSGYCQYPELTNLFHKTVELTQSKLTSCVYAQVATKMNTCYSMPTWYFLFIFPCNQLTLHDTTDVVKDVVLNVGSTQSVYTLTELCFKNYFFKCSMQPVWKAKYSTQIISTELVNQLYIDAHVLLPVDASMQPVNSYRC